MTCSALSLLWAALVLGQNAEPRGTPCSYLYEPAYCLDHALRGEACAYVPQPGDILLATDPSRFWTITHDLAFAFEPHNSGIVVARPDGSLALLEAGPNDTLWIGVVDLLPHLREYEAKGRVWIRKRKTPLTPEQSACLTEFAMRQEGKRFALIRMGGMLTPIRARGPLRTYFLGKPRGERDAYYCAELVMEAIVKVGLVDAETSRPGATFPHDLFYDHSHNLYLSKHFSLAHGWEPPARWVSQPVSDRSTAESSAPHPGARSGNRVSPAPPRAGASTRRSDS